MTPPPAAPSLAELEAVKAVEGAARDYARFTHGNLRGRRYREREEARDRLLDALATLEVARTVGRLSGSP